MIKSCPGRKTLGGRIACFGPGLTTTLGGLSWGSPPLLQQEHLASFHTSTGWQEAEACGEAAWPSALESHPHALLPSLQSTGKDRKCFHKVISGSRLGVEVSVDIRDSEFQHIRGGLGGKGRRGGPDPHQNAMYIIP